VSAKGASATFDNFWWWKIHFGKSKTGEETLEESYNASKPQENIQALRVAPHNSMEDNGPMQQANDQRGSESTTLAEQNLHGQPGWDMMMIPNDLLPWTTWSSSGFEYSSIETLMDMTNDHMPNQY
jgi:hypothetical protein